MKKFIHIFEYIHRIRNLPIGFGQNYPLELSDGECSLGGVCFSVLAAFILDQSSAFTHLSGISPFCGNPFLYLYPTIPKVPNTLYRSVHVPSLLHSSRVSAVHSSICRQTLSHASSKVNRKPGSLYGAVLFSKVTGVSVVYAREAAVEKCIFSRDASVVVGGVCVVSVVCVVGL